MKQSVSLCYRQAQPSDIPQMAEIRAADWGTEEYWRERILKYVTGKLHPREALPERVAFVCVDQERIVGLIAGHLTRRFGCDGELEWISVRPEHRNQGIASQLLRRLAEWFVGYKAATVCVDVEPSNHAALHFYARNGAEDLKPHWMMWKNIRELLKQ
jgi:ribosomal protein S18 acetylase RimI-like enzyme